MTFIATTATDHMARIAAEKAFAATDAASIFEAQLRAKHDAKRAANRAAIAQAEANPIQRTETVTPEAATDAQVNYLVSLLPRYFAEQAEDGITSRDLRNSDGGIDRAALRALTKREASALISDAKMAR